MDPAGLHAMFPPSDRPASRLQEASLPRVFKLFRALGLRHLVVVDNQNQVGPQLWSFGCGKKQGEGCLLQGAAPPAAGPIALP